MRFANQDHVDIYALRRHLECPTAIYKLKLDSVAGCPIGYTNSVLGHDEACIGGLDNDLDPVADLAAAGSLERAGLTAFGNLIAYIAVASDGRVLKRYCVRREECLDDNIAAVRNEEVALSVCKLALFDVIHVVHMYLEPGECIALSCQRTEHDLAADCGFNIRVIGDRCVIDDNGVAVAAAVKRDADFLFVADELAVDGDAARRHSEGVLLSRTGSRIDRNEVAVSVAGNGQVEA